MEIMCHLRYIFYSLLVLTSQTNSKRLVICWNSHGHQGDAKPDDEEIVELLTDQNVVLEGRQRGLDVKLLGLGFFLFLS